MTTYVVNRNGEEYATIDAESIDDAVKKTERILKSHYEYLEGMLTGYYGSLNQDEPLTFDPENDDTIGDEIFIESTVDVEDVHGLFFNSVESIIEQLLQHGEVLFETGGEMSGEIAVQITNPRICWNHPVFVIEKCGLSRVVYHPVPEKVEKTERPQGCSFHVEM
jgi:hypothetical protein